MVYMQKAFDGFAGIYIFIGFARQTWYISRHMK